MALPACAGSWGRLKPAASSVVRASLTEGITALNPATTAQRSCPRHAHPRHAHSVAGTGARRRGCGPRASPAAQGRRDDARLARVHDLSHFCSGSGADRQSPTHQRTDVSRQAARQRATGGRPRQSPSGQSDAQPGRSTGRAGTTCGDERMRSPAPAVAAPDTSRNSLDADNYQRCRPGRTQATSPRPTALVEPDVGTQVIECQCANGTLSARTTAALANASRAVSIEATRTGRKRFRRASTEALLSWVLSPSAWEVVDPGSGRTLCRDARVSRWRSQVLLYYGARRQAPPLR